MCVCTCLCVSLDPSLCEFSEVICKVCQFRRLSALHSVVLLRVPDFLESTRISWCWTIWSDWRILCESVAVFCAQELVFVIFPHCLLHHGIFFASLGDSGEIRADNHDNCFMHWIGNSSSMHNDSMWERIPSLERQKNRWILVPSMALVDCLMKVFIYWGCRGAGGNWQHIRNSFQGDDIWGITWRGSGLRDWWMPPETTSFWSWHASGTWQKVNESGWDFPFVQVHYFAGHNSKWFLRITADWTF